MYSVYNMTRGNMTYLGVPLGYSDSVLDQVYQLIDAVACQLVRVVIVAVTSLTRDSVSESSHRSNLHEEK